MADSDSSTLTASPPKFGWRRRRPRTPGSMTALDLDGQSVWIAQAGPKGGRAGILRVDAVPLELPADADRNDPAVLGRALSGALARRQLKPGSVVMGVPRAQVVLRTLTLPLVEDVRELASMVHLQVGKDLPFRAEDAVIDFKVHRPAVPAGAGSTATSGSTAAGSGGAAGNEPAAAAPGPRLEVLVAAVHRDVVAFCEQTAEAAGLKLSGLGLRAYGNARCLAACGAVAADQGVALVSLRPDEVNIDVLVGDDLLFSRGAVMPSAGAAAGGATGVTDAGVSGAGAGGGSEPAGSPVPGFADAATIEVVRTLHGYGGMAARSPVAKVIVSGATGQEEAVVLALERRLGVPCLALDPVAGLGLEAGAREPARGGVAAMGLALGWVDPEGLPFDFLSPKKPAVQRDLRRIRLLAGVAAAAALFLVLLLVRSQLTERRMAGYRAVELELNEAKKKQPIFRTMRQQALTVEEWSRGERDWLDHYAYLSAILPPSDEVYLNSFATTPQGVIRLGVQARSGEILARLDKQLRAAGYEIKPLAITPGSDRHGYDFSSTVELSVPDKMKIDLAKVRPPARPSDDGSMDPGMWKGGRP